VTARVSRRQFLAGSGAATVATVLAGCGPSPSPSPTPLPSPSPSPTPPPPTGYFEAIAELRDAVRGSPDHRVAAAERAVATKDPAAILRFVHDDIATYPAGPRNTGDLAEGVRWGTRATLRRRNR
jgi:TAT (twin-arginine translocation) pathway-exported protein